MGRQKKAAKKFAPKLKNEIEKRKERQKVQKRKHQQIDRAVAAARKETSEHPEESELGRHKAELDALRSTQKEFFDFLEKENPTLLQFGEDELIEKEEEEGEEQHVLTKEILEKWTKEAYTNTTVVKHLVHAFHNACHLNDTREKESANDFSQRYTIINSSVFNDLMLFCLKNLAKIFDTHLKRGEKANAKDVEPTGEEKKLPFLPNRYPTRWNKVKVMIKSFLGSLLHFMDGLADPNMLVFVLKQTQEWPHYFGPFQSQGKAFLKHLLNLWSSSDEAVRILAFLNIRNLAIHLPYPFIEDCLKGVYLTYVRNSKFTTDKTQALVNFMANCVVELYGLDSNAAYQHAFVYIRQISIHLRTAYTAKTKENQQNVYNWQTINSIKVWVQLLCAFPHDTQLWLLAYPIVQLIHGIINLLPIARYFPLRCHCLRMLNALSSTGKDTNIFLNSAAYALDMLNYDGFYKKTKPYTGKKINGTHILSIPDKQLGTKIYLEFIVTQVHIILMEYFASYSSSIAFPELIIPTLVGLKKYLARGNKVSTSPQIRSLLEALQNNSQFILAKRNKCTFGPAKTEKLVDFSLGIGDNSPLMKYKTQQDAIYKAQEAAFLNSFGPQLPTEDEARPQKRGRKEESEDDSEIISGSNDEAFGFDDNASEDDEADFDSLSGDGEYDSEGNSIDGEDEEMVEIQKTKKAGKPGKKSGDKRLNLKTNTADEVEDLDISKW